MGKVIACINEKGGVAKTTTIKNLAVGLAMKGKKVLAIDIDPSANLTKCLGVRLPDDEVGGICDILEKSIDIEEFEDGLGIYHHPEGIDLITSTNVLHVFESKLNEAFQREIVLRRYINTIKDKYDFILIDCPAGLGIFVSNALFCADSLVIPVQAKPLDVEAMQNLFVRINQVRKLNGTGTKPTIAGILFTVVRPNTSNDTSIMKQLKENYNKNANFFDTFIPVGTKIPESDAKGESIFKYAKTSTSALNYEDFVDEFLRRMEEENEGEKHGE